MRRSLINATIAAAVAGAAIIVFAYVGGRWYLRQSLPEIDGAVRVAGISAPIEIIRDVDDVPHVFASTRLDALTGLGYVHAQDRLWQMEFQRHIASGRLSEIFGTVTVPQDRFLRTVGFGRAARASWDGAPDWVRAQIDAYVRGVNAFIATHHGRRLPPEFSVLRFEPEPWDGVDVIGWSKMMAWDLSGNYSFELLRDDLVRAVGDQRMQQLMPPYPKHGLSIVPEPPGGPEDEGTPAHGGRQAALPGELAEPPLPNRPRSEAGGETFAWAHALSSSHQIAGELLLGGSLAESLGSNNWVVDGSLSATGKPLLANDPHLSAKTPSTWYLAHVQGGDLDVIGATLPGTPVVAIGRNRFIAWGETNVLADVEDLYRERLDAEGRRVEFQGRQEPIATRPETIKVKGSEPVHFDVRLTRHGPLVSDALNVINAALPHEPRPPQLEPLSFRWTALDPDDTTVQSFLELNVARNWTEFTSALRDLVAPSQNFVYADVDGHIGYYAPGRVPIRAHGDGSRPADGWTGEAEWTGWVPFDELPHLFDPPSHFIVSANNRPAPDGYPYLLGLDWAEPYRAARISSMLRAGSRWSVDDFARMQADRYSLHAETLLPQFLRHVHAHDDLERRAVDLLRQWNRDARPDSAATAIFAAWFHQLTLVLVEKQLGPLVAETYSGKFSYVTRFIEHTLDSGGMGWCGEPEGNRREACDGLVTTALDRAIRDLRERLGGEMSRWRWDAVHPAVFPHQGLDGVRVLRPWLSRSVPNGGDWSTVDVGPVAVEHPYEQHSVPGYRQIVDLSSANDSRFLDAVGESGHPLSKHYDDFLGDWGAVRYRPMRFDRGAVEKAAIGRLRLTP